jgi:protein-tyrosine phosphatase
MDSASFSNRPPGFARGRRRWIALLAVALAVAAVGVRIVWDSGYCSIRDLLLPRSFEAVIPGALYRSGQISPHLIGRVLAEHHIAVVVDLSNPVSNSDEQAAEFAAATRLGVEYHRFPLRGDGTGDVHNYVDAIATIERAERRGQPVLVHCVAGDKRSGGVVAAWLLLFRGATADEAMNQIGLCNTGHVASCTVVAYLNAHLREIADELQCSGFDFTANHPLPVLVGGG